jgi:hypothetical protein
VISGECEFGSLQWKAAFIPSPLVDLLVDLRHRPGVAIQAKAGVDSPRGETGKLICAPASSDQSSERRIFVQLAKLTVRAQRNLQLDCQCQCASGFDWRRNEKMKES